MTDARKFPAITKLVDDGLKKEINGEFAKWNARQELERFPLSPSQIGKCSLLLARNLAHYLGLASYPRTEESRSPRLQRIFKRGHLLEESLIGDIELYTPLKVVDRQKRVSLFVVQTSGKNVRMIEGDIDGITVSPKGARVLVDFKSKGAFYSAGFTDSIGQFFEEMKQTGLVEDLGDNAYFITDVKKLFDIMSMDDFFVDYLLQLNSYAFSGELIGTIDFVSLYYENKNTCANYEIRWVPRRELFDYAKDKFNYIYDTVLQKGPESVPKDFSLGSARCRLCEYNETCWGKYVPKAGGKVVGNLSELPNGSALDKMIQDGTTGQYLFEKAQVEILAMMEHKQLTHVQTSGGIVYERKLLKSPKPHFELRLSRGDK